MDAPDLIVSLKLENARLQEQVVGLLEERQRVIDAKDKIIDLLTQSVAPNEDEMLSAPAGKSIIFSRSGIFLELVVLVFWGMALIPPVFFSEPFNHFAIGCSIFVTVVTGLTLFLVAYSDTKQSGSKPTKKIAPEK